MRTAEELKYAPSLKLKRARDHINELNGQVEAFLEKSPFKLMERHHRKAGKTTYRVKVETPIPPEFSLIVGDAVHNMRAALDMVLFGMVGDVDPKISFPFSKTLETLKAAIKDGHVKAAGTKVVEAISALEPYATGDKGLGLCTIHALDIQDKHHLLILSAQRAVFTTGTGNEAILQPILHRYKPGVHLILDGPQDTDLVVIHRPYATRDLADTENEAKVQPAFAITFREGGFMPTWPVVQTLRALAEDAEAAVDTLVAAFLDPANTFP